MPEFDRPAGSEPRIEDILTLSEAAAYLRVSEDAVRKMATDKLIPAQKIGSEWRFLRRGLNDWMRYGDDLHRRTWPVHPEFFLEPPFVEDLLQILESRLLRKLKAEVLPTPGSKQAVLKHFGIFKDDEDLKERLDDARTRREAT